MFHQTPTMSSGTLFKNLLRCSQSILKRNASSLDGKMMNKVMGLTRKTKKVWYQSNVGANPTFEELMKQTTKKNAGRQASKRVDVLNKLIMTNITDIMATGEQSDKLTGFGLEISKVTIAGDYRSVNVFWMANKFEDDSQLEELLQTISGPLRHELSRLRIMGEIPKIQFVKDKSFSNIAAVDRLLNKADFGEDFIPTCPTLLKNHPIVFANLDPEIKNKIKELEDTENLDEESYDEEDTIPEMKMDVMGLDHSAIMTRLNASIQKAKALHRLPNAVPNEKNIKTESVVEPQYLSFTDFVKKRKIQEAKALGRRRSRSIEKEMYDRELSSNNEEEDDNNNIEEFPFKI